MGFECGRIWGDMSVRELGVCSEVDCMAWKGRVGDEVSGCAPISRVVFVIEDFLVLGSIPCCLFAWKSG